jgi:uncharacterized protein YbjT (DUF2867 family)
VTDHRALVIGATGAVGSALVRELLASPRWVAVTVLTRRATGMFAGAPGAAKLSQRVVDVDRVDLQAREPAAGCEAAFCTMGIGQPRKVPREEFWKVDVEYASAFARACKEAGVRHMSLLGAIGANPRSSNYYARVKGTVEERFRSLAFARLSLFRPSVLVTEQLRYGFQDWLTQHLFPWASRLLPSRFHEIRVEGLARAMRLNAERDGAGADVLYYDDCLALLRSAERF